MQKSIILGTLAIVCCCTSMAPQNSWPGMQSQRLVQVPRNNPYYQDINALFLRSQKVNSTSRRIYIPQSKNAMGGSPRRDDPPRWGYNMDRNNNIGVQNNDIMGRDNMIGGAENRVHGNKNYMGDNSYSNDIKGSRNTGLGGNNKNSIQGSDNFLGKGASLNKIRGGGNILKEKAKDNHISGQGNIIM